MAKIKSFGERIADALVEDGLLGANQVEELLEQQKKQGARLVKLIIEKAYVSEQDLAVCMGRVLNVTPINISAGKGWAQAIADRCKPGSVTTAYVDPANPYNAFLYRRVSLMPLLFVAFPLGFGLLYGFALRSQRRQVQLSEKLLVPVVPASASIRITR